MRKISIVLIVVFLVCCIFTSIHAKTERDHIKDGPHLLSWAYYTGSNSRWYISTTLDYSSYFGNIYSLTPIKNGRAGWATVAKDAINLDLIAFILSTENNLDNDNSDRYYDIGWQEWVEDSMIHRDRQWIQGKTEPIKWFFFRVSSTGLWYIINVPGYGSGTHILKFSSKDGQYDWKKTDTTDLTPIFFQNDGKLYLDFNETDKFTIFAGISGGNALEGDLFDGGDGIKSWKDKWELKNYIINTGILCGDCTKNTDLNVIAANNRAGGIVAIAYNVSYATPSRSSFNTSGNTDVIRADIETFYNTHPNAKVFVAGHSTGGGDTQNLLWKLKTLGIPVEMSGHIDSVEILSADAKIPNNTKRAMGFYQNDGAWITRGEDNLIADDTSKTTVTNTRISNPVGPANPNTDSNAYHRNMDNDPRVWNTLLDYIKNHW